MNDAESAQNVLGSYGKNKVNAMKKTAAKNDPNRFPRGRDFCCGISE